MSTPEEREEKEQLLKLLEKAMQQQQDIARASYCLERSVRRIAEGMTEPKLQSLRETLMNAIEFARSKLPELPEDLPKALEPSVSGRNLRLPDVLIDATLSGVVFRVEDGADHAFWLQMVVPSWILYHQLGQVDTGRP